MLEKIVKYGIKIQNANNTLQSTTVTAKDSLYVHTYISHYD